MSDKLDNLEARLAMAAPLVLPAEADMPVSKQNIRVSKQKRPITAEALEAMGDDVPRYMQPGTTEFANAVSTQANRDFWQDPESRANPPTDKQVNYLSYLLGDHMGYFGLVQFVRFANGYHHGRLTRFHWVQAIELAKNGHNLYGNARYLLSLSF